MPSYVRSGAALTVNSKTASTQMRSSIKTLSDGGFIVVWQSSDPSADGSGYAIRAQRYNAQGAAVGPETLINSSTAGDQNWPQIAILASGGYVVTWDTSDITQDGSGFAIKARLFDASGAPLGTEFRVNTQAVADQKQPNVVALSDGGFLIAWQTSDTAQDGSGAAIKAQRFDSAGVAVGGEFLVNAGVAGQQTNVDLAALANGGFVATWQSGTGGAGTQVNGQVFGANGARIGSEFNASNGTGTHTAGHVAALANGGFVLTWASAGSSLAQFFDAAGNKVGAQFAIPGSSVEVASLANGTLMFTWWDDSGSVKARVYDSGGLALGPQTTVFQGGSTTGFASAQAVAVLANGNIVLSWDHFNSATGDLDVRMQMLRPNTGLDLGVAARTLSVAENGFSSQVLATVAPLDSPGMAITYSIVGGADAGRFTINAAGELRLTASPNFEAPTDSNGDNLYEVIIRASDGEYSDDQAFTVAVTNVNEAPTITSHGSSFNVALTVGENQTVVTTLTATDPDGQTNLTYSIVSGADRARFAINATTGVLSFVSAPNFEAPADVGGNNVYDVTVSVSDGSKSDTKAFAITVANVNEGVTISGSQTAYSLLENGTAVASFSATDLDGDAIAWSIAGGADAARFAIDAATGALRFVAAPDFEAPGDSGADNVYNVTISASDGSLSASRSLTVAVLNQNEAPVITSNGGGDAASVSVAENGVAVTIVAASDAEGSALSYSITGGADASRFLIDSSTGALRFLAAPDREQPGDSDGDNVYEVTVRASDGTSSDSQTLAITVANVNEAPIFGSGASLLRQIDEGRTAVATVAASDPDGTPVTYSISGGPHANLFAIDPATGELSFIAAPDYEAPAEGSSNVYTVAVTASDGQLSSVQSVQVTVGNVNEGVTITSGGDVSVAENGTAVTMVSAVDLDGDTVSYAITGGADAALFAIDAATGALAFLAAPDFEAPGDSDGDNVYAVEVSAGDGQLSDVKALSVTVTNRNEGIFITSNGGGNATFLSIDEGERAITTVVASDPDGTPVTYSIIGGSDASLFSIDALTGVLTLNQAPDHEAPVDWLEDNYYDVIVAASDGETSDWQSVVVAVDNVNEGVAITSDGGGDTASVTRDESHNYVTQVTGSDVDGDRLTYSIVGGADAALFEIDPVAGHLFFRQTPDFEAPADADGDNVYEVTVRTSDGEYSDDQQLSVTVTDIDDGPVILSYGGADNVALTLSENEGEAGQVYAWSSTGDPVTYAIVGGADAGLFAVDPETGNLAFLDGSGRDFEAPGDADGDNVYDVVVSARSGTASNSQALAVTIVNRNEGVFITSNGGGTSAALSLNEGQSQVTTVVASDPDGTIPTYSIVGGPDAARFTIDPSTGVLSFVHAPDYEAPDDESGDNFYTVQVAASDGEVTSWQTIQVLVGNVNEGVTINSGGGADSISLFVDENGSTVTSVSASDVDGDPVGYAIAGGADAARFTIDSSTGALSFVASPDFEAPADADGDNVYEVIVSASDGSFTDSQSVAVSVRNVNEAPVIGSNGGAAAAAVAVAENGTAVTSVSAIDPDGGSLTYAIVGGADAAKFRIDPATGLLAFVTAPDFEAPGDAGGNNVYDVIVAAGDGSLTDTQALAVSVGNVNEAVSISSNGGGASAAVAVAENGTAVTVVLAADADGGTVTYAIAGGADAARFRIDAATGALAFVAAPNFEAPTDAGGNNVYDVVVSATDGVFTDTQALAVSVGNVNEAPVIGSNGGGVMAMVSVSENSRTVTTVAAADSDGTALTYSISGGADASRFTINAQTGALQFVTAPDYETPGDADGNNVYDVIVKASDGQLFDTQVLAVAVANQLDGNIVNGTTAGDSISGTSTNPALRTTNSEDTVSGRDGHDTILGLGGDDIINGDAGNDTITGGAGADRLTGGLGKDTFVYNATSESTAASRDVITDFSRAQGDKINLSAIDANVNAANDQSFAFIGSAAFSHVAGQLRFEAIGGNTFVSGDVNGDGVADFQIELTGTIGPLASDFVL